MTLSVDGCHPFAMARLLFDGLEVHGGGYNSGRKGSILRRSDCNCQNISGMSLVSINLCSQSSIPKAENQNENIRFGRKCLASSTAHQVLPLLSPDMTVMSSRSATDQTIVSFLFSVRPVVIRAIGAPLASSQTRMVSGEPVSDKEHDL